MISLHVSGAVQKGDSGLIKKLITPLVKLPACLFLCSWYRAS